MDDDHTLQWEIFLRTDGKQRPGGTHKIARPGDPQVRPRQHEYLPHGTGWYDRFRDRAEPRQRLPGRPRGAGDLRSYTGIPGIRQQDMAVTETMGPIYDRRHEHLGTTDPLIIRTRRR